MQNKVVGWGAFPMSTPDSEVISGKFKVPLLRGEVDKRVVKYDQIERRISRDIDTWLANLYFDVKHLPRHLGKKQDLDVVMSFSDNMLQLKQRHDTDGNLSDEDDDDHKKLAEEEAETAAVDDNKRVKNREGDVKQNDKSGETDETDPLLGDDAFEDEELDPESQRLADGNPIHPSSLSKKLEQYKVSLSATIKLGNNQYNYTCVCVCVCVSVPFIQGTCFTC